MGVTLLGATSSVNTISSATLSIAIMKSFPETSLYVSPVFQRAYKVTLLSQVSVDSTGSVLPALYQPRKSYSVPVVESVYVGVGNSPYSFPFKTCLEDSEHVPPLASNVIVLYLCSTFIFTVLFSLTVPS